VTETGTELRIAVAAFAARPRVLVAADFDRTLTPFVLEHMQAGGARWPCGLRLPSAASSRLSCQGAISRRLRQNGLKPDELRTAALPTIGRAA